MREEKETGTFVAHCFFIEISYQIAHYQDHASEHTSILSYIYGKCGEF